MRSVFLVLALGCGPVPDDGSCDEADKIIAFADGDGDNFGKALLGDVCAIGPGMATNNTDCNDTIAEVFPGATEICDGLDNNCDGGIDEGFPVTTYYADFDHDGYGDDGRTITTCQNPGEDWTLEGGDCDDEHDTVNPAGVEVCGNGLDDDCNTLVDDIPEVCNDGVDNDCDLLADCDDPDCLTELECIGVADCADDVLANVPSSVYGTTLGATSDWSWSCGYGTSEDHTWQFRAPQDGTYVFDTQGSVYDTVLSAFDDCGGYEIACNDDTFYLQSQISLRMVQGEVVFIVVGGFGGAAGTYTLSVDRF